MLGGMADRFKFRWGERSVDPLEFIARSAYWPFAQRNRRLESADALRAVPNARPPPQFGALDELRAERITLDVPAHCEEVPVILYGKGFETSLVEVAVTFRTVERSPALRVGGGHPVEEVGEPVIVLRTENEMPVIWHDAE